MRVKNMHKRKIVSTVSHASRQLHSTAGMHEHDSDVVKTMRSKAFPVFFKKSALHRLGRDEGPLGKQCLLDTARRGSLLPVTLELEPNANSCE